MTFSEALFYLKNGKYLKIGEWREDAVVYLYSPSSVTMTKEQLSENTYINVHFRMWNKKKKTVEVYIPTTEDLLSNNWEIVNEMEKVK